MPYISATIIIQLLTARRADIEQARAGRGRPDETNPIRGAISPCWLCFGWGFAMALQWENPSKIFGEGIGQLVMYPPPR